MSSLNWRNSGDCNVADWIATIPIASRIRQDGEVQACYDAAKGYTRLCLGMLNAESSYATSFSADPATNKNALNLRPRGGSGFSIFPSWSAGITEWLSRLTDPNYAYKDTQTVADLVAIYAPSSDNNNVIAYVNTVETVISRLAPIIQSTGVSTVPALNMTQDLIPLPTVITKVILDSENMAWDNIGPKLVKGFVLHRQLGTNDGTDQYFRTMANAQTTRAGGLTEFGQRATGGEIFLWNSPLGFAGQGFSANRSPWASGVYNVHGDAYGDGLAFVRKYGVNAVNEYQVAWEIDGFYDDPWSDAAQAESAQACAHYAHNYGIQWDQFPIHPDDGFSFVRWHQELTGPAEKICPGPVVMNATPAWIERTRAIMKTAQTGATVPTTPAKPPKQPKYAKPVKITKASLHCFPYGADLTCIKAYTPRDVASPNGKATGPDVKVGAKVRMKWLLVAEDGTAWFCSTGGSRNPAWGFFADIPSHQ